MKTAHELADLITLRNFAYTALNGIEVHIPKEHQKTVQQRIYALDKAIVAGLLELQLPGSNGLQVINEVASAEQVPVAKKNASFRKSTASE